MIQAPVSLDRADPARLRQVRFVLTDVDDTLTLKGRLPTETFAALAALQAAEVQVIPVTAAPAGWADGIARMWPVDAVIAENGGLYLHCPQNQAQNQTKGASVPDRVFWHGEARQTLLRGRLQRLSGEIASALPGVTLAADQPFRLTSLAFDAPNDPALQEDLLHWLRMAGCSTTVNSLWVLGWLGVYDKLSMARKLLAERFDFDLLSDPDAVFYVGDSLNDEPMFAALPLTAGVSTVRDYLPRMQTAPTWITDRPGGLGFADVARVLLQARTI